jgi:hypothetical protein
MDSPAARTTRFVPQFVLFSGLWEPSLYPLAAVHVHWPVFLNVIWTLYV